MDLVGSPAADGSALAGAGAGAGVVSGARVSVVARHDEEETRKAAAPTAHTAIHEARTRTTAEHRRRHRGIAVRIL